MPVSGQEASSLVAKRGSADLCDMDCVFCVTGGGEDGEGVVRMGFRAVVLTSVTWIWCFVSQGEVKVVKVW